MPKATKGEEVDNVLPRGWLRVALEGKLIRISLHFAPGIRSRLNAPSEWIDAGVKDPGWPNQRIADYECRRALRRHGRAHFRKGSTTRWVSERWGVLLKVSLGKQWMLDEVDIRLCTVGHSERMVS